jgi:hypothetical protein
MRTYWEGLLGGEGALFDDEFSRLTGSRSVRIEHDPSNVEALQVSRTERLMRAQTLMLTFGATPAEALAFEGFPNAPWGEIGTSSRRPAKEVDEPQRDVEAVLRNYLQGAAYRYQAIALAVDSDPTRLGDCGDEAAVLCEQLAATGMPQGRAAVWGAEVATLSAEAVRQVCSTAAEAGTVRIGFENLAAFGPERAKTLAAAITKDVA